MYLEPKTPYRFYVYAYLSSDNQPYYIGKGNRYRAWQVHKTKFIENYTPTDRSKILILEDKLSNVGAMAIERRLIRWYGRIDSGTGILINKSDGGDCGPYGRIVSEDTRRKMSLTNKGKPKPIISEETRKRMSLGQIGLKRPHIDATKMKISLKNKGRSLSESHKEKLKISSLGRVVSEETKRKISETRIQKGLKPPSRTKIHSLI